MKIPERGGFPIAMVPRGAKPLGMSPGDQMPQWEVAAVLALAHLAPAYRGNPVQRGVPAHRPAASGPLPLSVD